MLRPALASFLLTLPLISPLRAQANIDPTGTWRVQGVSNVTQQRYAGEVSIVPNGECYDVGWSLESGERYSGVGMVVELVGEAGQVFVAAWGGEGSGGVVFYEGLSVLNTEWFGTWCQADGRTGQEYLGAPSDLDGAHPLTGGDSGTGTVTITRVRNSETNYTIRWDTSAGSYTGFGSRGEPSFPALAGLWGSAQGVGFYVLGEHGPDQILGWWAAVGETEFGAEELTRR